MNKTLGKTCDVCLMASNQWSATELDRQTRSNLKQLAIKALISQSGEVLIQSGNLKK